MKTALHDKLKRHPARLELLLTELLDTKQLNEASLIVRPRSLFRRGYATDILDVATVAESDLLIFLYPEEHGTAESARKEPKTTRQKNTEATVVDVSREGFYDALPEFLFHAPEALAGYKSLDQRVRESEKAREEEARARKFFLPFEQMFFRQRIQLELEERKLSSRLANPMQRAVLERFWTEVGDINETHQSVLFHLLPLTHQIAGNRPLMSACFNAVLQDPVALNDLPPAEVPESDGGAPALGGATLGLDLVTEGAIADDLPGLSVSIGPIDLTGLPNYLAGGTKHGLLSILYSHFVPAGIDVATHILLKQPEAGFVLDDDDNGTARLAFSTYI